MNKPFEKEAERENQKHVNLNSIEDSVESISYSSDCFFQEDCDFSKYEELQLLVRGGALDDLYHDILSPPFQAFGDDVGMLSSVVSQNSQLIQPNQDRSCPFPSASLEILRHRIIAVNGRKMHEPTELEPVPPSLLSTNHIIELSAANFIQASSAMINPYASTFSTLAKDVRLIQDVLSCAEKVNNHQYDSAGKLLEECSKLSFVQMNTIQRLVYYFTDALRDKIGCETGKFAGKHEWLVDSTNVSSAAAAFHQKSPLNQAIQFASIQSVADHVADSRKIHIVDLGMNCGGLQMIIMQALAARNDQCPLEHLKVTAIATNPNLVTDEAGVRLETLAKSLNLNFSYHVMKLEEIVGLEKSLDPEETVVVHAAYALNRMIAYPNQLELLMRVVRSINPGVMIVTEIEANVNSPVFVNRFVEALFFYGAYFDCLGDCLKNEVAERTVVESNLFGPVIRNTVAAEGEERLSRAVGVNLWREFFARFGMVEMDISRLALDHAKLVVNRFECRDSCTLGLNGKCLIACWKGTPICSLSAWKFKEK